MRYCCMKAEAKGQDCREVTCPDSSISTQLGMSAIQVDEIIDSYESVKDTQETGLFRPFLEGRPRPKMTEPNAFVTFLYWLLLVVWGIAMVFLHQLSN